MRSIPSRYRRTGIVLVTLLLMPLAGAGATGAAPSVESDISGLNASMLDLCTHHRFVFALVVTLGMALLAILISAVSEFILHRLKPGGLP